MPEMVAGKNAGPVKCPGQFPATRHPSIPRDARFRSVNCPHAPAHLRRVVSDPIAALTVQQNQTAVAVKSRLKVADRLWRDELRRAARADAVGCPFTQHQFHERLTPACTGDRAALIVGVAAAAYQG